MSDTLFQSLYTVGKPRHIEEADRLIRSIGAVQARLVAQTILERFNKPDLDYKRRQDKAGQARLASQTITNYKGKQAAKAENIHNAVLTKK